MIVPQFRTWARQKSHVAAMIRTRMMRLLNRLRIRRYFRRG